MSNKKLLNFSELAEYLGRSRSQLRQLIKDGKFTVPPIIEYDNSNKQKPKYWSVDKVDEWLKNE